MVSERYFRKEDPFPLPLQCNGIAVIKENNRNMYRSSSVWIDIYAHSAFIWVTTTIYISIYIRNKKRKQSWNSNSTELLCLLTTISKSSCRFLQLLLNCSDVAYSKYHNLFFILLLNFWGFFSLSAWNLLQMAASCNQGDSEQNSSNLDM